MSSSVAPAALAPLTRTARPNFSAGTLHVGKNIVTSTPLPPATVQIERAKRLAAYAAVDEFVKPQHKIIGIGSGTTIPYAVERIVQQGNAVNEDVRCRTTESH